MTSVIAQWSTPWNIIERDSSLSSLLLPGESLTDLTGQSASVVVSSTSQLNVEAIHSYTTLSAGSSDGRFVLLGYEEWS